MRTDLSATITDGFYDPDGVNVRVRLRAYKTRDMLDISDITTGYGAAFGDNPGTVWPFQLSQDAKYDIARGKLVTAMSYGDKLYLGVNGQAVLKPEDGGATDVDAETYCRPSIAFDASNVYAFVLDDTGANEIIKKITIDPALLYAGTAACVTATENLWTIDDRCALHAVSDGTVAVLWIDDGGVRVSVLYWDGGAWVSDDWQGRFMHPIDLPDNTVDYEINALNYSAAVMDGDRNVYVYWTVQPDMYSTEPVGNVLGVMRSENGAWSDSFEAMPSDLSKFWLANGQITENGRFHLVGQFQREDTTGLDIFETDHLYCLDLASDDGRTFSVDRTTAFAYDNIAYRFQLAAYDPGSGFSKAYYTDANRYALVDARYSIANDNASNVIIDDAISLSGDYNQGWRVQLRNADERQLDVSLLEVGNLCNIECALENSGGIYEWFDFQLCIISAIREEYGDGTRRFQMTLVPFSSWRASHMTHPFDIEMKSKESLYEAGEFDNLYRATDEGFLVAPFMVDFWGDSDCEPGTHDALETTEYTTSDLLTMDLTDYPTIDALPFDIYMYGWSRSGNPTPYEGGTGDQPSDLAAPNDNIDCKLYVTHPDGTEEEITVDDVSPSGTYQYFPQTWYINGVGGDYPVILEGDAADGFEVGDQITKVGFIFNNERAPNTAETTFYPARVEIPDVAMHFDHSDEIWEPIELSAVAGCDLDLESTEEGSASFTSGGVLTINDEDTGAARTRIIMRLQNCHAKDKGIVGTIYADMENTGAVDVLAASQGDPCATYGYCPRYSDGASGVTLNVGDRKNVPGGWAPTNDGQTDGYLYFIFNVSGTNDAELTIHGIYATLASDTYTFWEPGGVCDTVDFPCSIELGEPAEEAQNLTRIGIPVVYLANTPYHTFNFEVAAKFYLSGENAYGGVVGLASDGQNYILARANPALVELIKVRDGLETVLDSVANTWSTTNRAWVYMKHQDGRFTVRIRDQNDFTADLIDYEWTESDGAMAVDADALHIGLYGLRDSPWARICGFDPAATDILGILPGTTDFDDGEFPASGYLRINQNVYSYSSLYEITGTEYGTFIEGPYQGANTGGGYNYTNNGYSYSGNAVEMRRFEWLPNSTYYDRFDDYLIAANSGICWVGGDTDFKPFIYTEGVQVFLKNRGRFYGVGIGGDQVGLSTKCWLTEGFGGLSLSSGEAGNTHEEGTIAHLENEDYVYWIKFFGSSGYEDATIADMIDKVCQLADAQVDFPGDHEDVSQLLDTTEWWIRS